MRRPRKECCRLDLVGEGGKKAETLEARLGLYLKFFHPILTGGRDDGEEHLLGNYWGSGVVIRTMYITHFIPYANLTD